MHDFDTDFYGHDMRAVVLGYIRPELDYPTRGWSCSSLMEKGAYSSPPEALIEDIETDKRVALKSLARPAYERFKSDAIFDTTQQPKL